jgi:uncharacterized membrane protein
MKSSSDATSWAVVLMAATSVVLMVCLYQIDNIVHGTLYNYGLQFSYNWAGPYWKMTQLGFAVGWVNIIVAFVVQLNAVARERANEKAQKSEKEQKQGEPPRKSSESTERRSPHEETSKAPPEPQEQEKKEEPQQPETKPDEIPSLSGLLQELQPEQT